MNRRLRQITPPSRPPERRLRFRDSITESLRISHAISNLPPARFQAGMVNSATMPTPVLRIDAWSSVPKPVIGMIHLAPLPGSPGYGGELGSIRESALRDADALVCGG